MHKFKLNTPCNQVLPRQRTTTSQKSLTFSLPAIFPEQKINTILTFITSFLSCRSPFSIAFEPNMSAQIAWKHLKCYMFEKECYLLSLPPHLHSLCLLIPSQLASIIHSAAQATNLSTIFNSSSLSPLFDCFFPIILLGFLKMILSFYPNLSFQSFMMSDLCWVCNGLQNSLPVSN